MVYIRAMPRRLTKINFDGVRYLKTGEYERALDAFKRFYDLYDRDPEREKRHARLLLMDDVSFRPREIALNNQAAAYIQLGAAPEAVRCYEACLALNPQNGVALMSLNLAASVSGGEMRPPPPQVSPAACIKGAGHSRSRAQSYVSILLILIAVPCCLLPLVSLLLEQPTGDGSAAVIVTGLIFASVVTLVGIWQITQIITRLVLKDYYQGSKLYRKHQYREGIQAFQKQIDLFEKRPWLNNRRRLFKRANHISYLEWTLLWMAYGYVQLGEGDQLIPIYRRVLDVNPDNDAAKTNIKFVNLFRGDELA
jgi:tetratricopeptide (TPR) repeat protein